jgi:methyl-accepting chemotaxis protein
MSTDRDPLSTVRRRYEALLWGTMDRLGVSESIERKVVTAVGIQFLVTVAIFLTPFLLSGALATLVSGALFLGAVAAIYNTLLIVRRDFVAPLRRLEAGAEAIAAGDVGGAAASGTTGGAAASGTAGGDAPGDSEPIGIDQPDEIGSLVAAFVEVERYLGTVSAKAEALAAREFDDPVLDEPVPGRFGDALDEMAADMTAYTTELESVMDAFDEATERAQGGDLTATIDAESLAGDAGRYDGLVENYNRLITSLGGTVGEVRSFTDDVAAASDDVRTSVDEVDAASEEVARSIQEISDGATEQTDDLEAAAAEMNTLSATVEEIAAAADDAAATARSAADRGRTGRDEATEAIAELEALDARIGETAAAVEDLADRIDEIDEIAAVIDGIAKETNLLALNASIEAARADGSGDGFAVVADEVKSLAEETRGEAAAISERIEAIQSVSAETTAEVDAMESQVSESVGAVESTLREFEEVVEEVTAVDETVQEISEATDDQARTTQEVVDVVEDVAAVSGQTASEAETVAAAAEEQTASVSAVTDRAHALADRSDELLARLDAFEVPRDAETGGVGATESRASAQARPSANGD